MSDDLDSIHPRKAFDMWLKRQRPEVSDSTYQSYEYRVEPFLEYLDERGIDDLANLRRRDVIEFDTERRTEDVQLNTLNNQMGTLRQFLGFAYTINAVPEEIVESVPVPELSKEERVNTEKLPTARAERILDQLDTYHYASLDHVLMLLLWRTTARVGAIHSLDLQDLYLDDDDLDRLDQELQTQVEGPVREDLLDQVELPFIWFRHRPDQGTPLKNGNGGERPINIAEWVGDVIQDYIRYNRRQVTDEHGREPLFPSSKIAGRLSRSGMRIRVYRLTQPCELFNECPHDRDPEECEAREHGYESRCPSARSPHKIRTGSITMHRDRGWPLDQLSQKANASTDLLEGVYDQPEKLKRVANRRSILDRLDQEE